MPAWDRMSSAALRKQREKLVLAQLRDAVGPFSPFWRERFQAMGLKPATVKAADFDRLPAVGERDVCTDGDPASAAKLVLQATEVGYALHAEGPALRKAFGKRLVSRGAYRMQVEADTRPTTYGWTGHGLRFPVASTRSDLDVIARAGARLWQVIGLDRSDVVVDAYSLDSTPTRVALDLAAVASATPAFRAGSDPAEVLAAVRLLQPTVLITTPAECTDLLEELATSGADLSRLKTLVLVGAPTADDRRAAVQALGDAAAASDAVVVAVYAPSGARVLWGECRESARAGRPTGFHTYPDLDLVELADAHSGEISAQPSDEPRELVLTQLGLRGSALVRWRTGDLVEGRIDESTCGSCGRTVARVPSDLRSGALVSDFTPRGGRATRVDLRAVSGALAGRGDVSAWQVELRRSPRSGGDELLVHIAPIESADPAEAAVGVARDVKAAAGLLPTQVVIAEAATLRGGRLVDRR